MLSTLSIQELVRNRCAPEVPEPLIGLFDYFIDTSITDALIELGREIAEGSNFRQLQAEFTGAPSSGVLAISTMTPVDAANDPTRILFLSFDSRVSAGMLLQFRESADATNKLPFIRVPRRSAFYGSDLAGDAVHYFIEGDGNIAFVGPNGKLPGDGGAYGNEITMTASVSPTLAIVDAKPTLRDRLIAIVANMALGALKKAPEAALAR